MSAVLEKFLTAAHQLGRNERLPYWAIYAIFDSIAGSKSLALSSRLDKLSDTDFEQPSIEMLLVYAYFSQALTCSLEEHKSLFENYKKKRGNKSGIRFPRLFEAAIGLELAERYRLAGDLELWKQTALLAADDYPENEKLRDWVRKMTSDDVVSWGDILLEKENDGAVQQAARPRQDAGGVNSVKQRLKAFRTNKARRGKQVMR
jgi:hypothetical protein